VTLRRVVIALFGLIGIALVPWGIWLGASLEPQHTTNRWDVVWTGFDIGLALAFGLTAFAAWRRSPWVGALAATTGTLLLVDAWFDIVLESHGSNLRMAIGEALFGEIPVAILCYWIAYRTERFLARAVTLAGGPEAPALHVATTRKRPPESDLVGVLEVATNGEPAGEPRDADLPA
jgi:hypothetical protein